MDVNVVFQYCYFVAYLSSSVVICSLIFAHFTSIDAVDEEQHMVYFSGNSPTALNERHAYVASYQPSATTR